MQIINNNITEHYLPELVISKICDYLSFEDQTKLSKVNRRIHSTIENKNKEFFSKTAQHFALEMEKPCLNNINYINEIIKYSKINNFINLIKSDNLNISIIRNIQLCTNELKSEKSGEKIYTLGYIYSQLSNKYLNLFLILNNKNETPQKDLKFNFQIRVDRYKSLNKTIDKICFNICADLIEHKDILCHKFQKLEIQMANAFELQIKMYIDYFSKINLDAISNDDIDDIKKGNIKTFNSDKNGQIINFNEDRKIIKFSIKTQLISSISMKATEVLVWTSEDFNSQESKEDFDWTKDYPERQWKISDLLRLSIYEETTRKLTKQINFDLFDISQSI